MGLATGRGPISCVSSCGSSVGVVLALFVEQQLRFLWEMVALVFGGKVRAQRRACTR